MENRKLKIGIHYVEGMADYSWSYAWEKILKEKGIEVKRINFYDTDVMKQVKDCDGIMWHWFHYPNDKIVAPKILSNIQLNMDIPIFPDLNSCWHYDEKVAQHYLLESIDAPRVPSWVFYDYNKASEFINSADYPLVFKLSVGAGSANILKIDNKEEAKDIVDKMFKKGIFPYTLNEFENTSNQKHRIKEAIKYVKSGEYPTPPWYYMLQKDYVYFQKFLPNNNYDIRIVVIGDRAFGFVRYNRENDFRASGSGKKDYDITKVPIEAVKIAFNVSKRCKFQSMAYDFMYWNNKVVINEISYCYGSGTRECKGYWDSKLNWHDRQMSPEEAHVEDFLEIVKKKVHADE